MASFVSSKAGSEARVCTDWMEFEIDKLTNSKNIQNHLKLVCFFNVFLFFLLAGTTKFKSPGKILSLDVFAHLAHRP